MSKKIMLSRPQVAALASMTDAEVRRLDEDVLHPIRGRDGSWLYQPERVIELLRKRWLSQPRPGGEATYVVSAPGEIASRVFVRFDNGEGPAQVVIGERLNPFLVAELRQTFDHMTGSLSVPGKIKKEIESILGTRVDSGPELVEQLKEQARRSAAPTRTSERGTLRVEEDDFGSIIDPTTRTVRPLTREEVEKRLAALDVRRSNEETPTAVVSEDSADHP